MTVLFDVTPAERALNSILATAFSAIDPSPIIHIHDPALRASRVDELPAVLRDVDETCAAVARLETRLKWLSLRLHLRRSAVTAAMAPVTGLSTELLQKIFMHVAQSDKTSKARIVLSHVSSSWREASIGLPELWTIIQVPYRHTDMVYEFARRSEALRFELSALSEWPKDLELEHPGFKDTYFGLSLLPDCPGSFEPGRFEVSRLSSIVFTSQPAPLLLDSIERFDDLLRLDKFVAPAHLLSLSGMRACMRSCRCMELIGPRLPSDWMQSCWSTRLVSLTLRLQRTTIKDLNNPFRFFHAPLLHEVTFEGVDSTDKSSTASSDDSDDSDDSDHSDHSDHSDKYSDNSDSSDAEESGETDNSLDHCPSSGGVAANVR